MREHKPEHFHLIEVEQEFLTNTPSRGERPVNLSWEYYLFCRGFKRTKTGKLSRYPIRFLHCLTAPSEDEVVELLEEFVTRPNVTLLEKKHETKTA